MLRRLALLAPVVLFAASPAGCLGCGGETESHDPALSLGQRFPAQAARVVEARSAFIETAEGFAAAKEPNDALSAARGGLTAVLPRAPDGAVRFELPSGFSVQVRERGLSFGGARAGSAIAYPRAGGTSFWTATANDFEEWLSLDAGVATGEQAIAAWDIEGGALRMSDGTVEILDGAGVPRIRVQAPEAYTASGARVEPRLTVRGTTIELWTDARGEAVLVDPSWTATTNMNISRGYHAATLLLDGKAFVTGGVSFTGPCGVSGSQTSLSSTESYDPATAIWTSKAPMAGPHYLHTATLLQNGKVLIAGGFQGACAAAVLATAQLYDPIANTWSAVPSMAVARGYHTASLLPNGKVLIAGGQGAGVLSSTEIYDPGTNTWSAGASMLSAREFHFAVTLADGRIVVASGSDGSVPLTSAEIYDPASNTWSAAAPMILGSYYPAGALMGDGRVLTTGGWINQGGMPIWQTVAQAYDPATNTWSAVASMANARSSHKMVLLASGRVLVAGGESSGILPVGASEMYDPASNTWAPGGAMPGAEPRQTLTLLTSGKALAAGGFHSSTTYKTAELFNEGAAIGVGCATGSECASGFCVDSVCCNSPCAAGACDACSVAAGAAQNGVCSPLTGNACNDLNACTTNDTCQNGVCTGAPVVCAPLDTCHLAGSCNLITGTCSNPVKADGAACSDSNACTQTDTCQAGICTGANPVVCAALDQCHVAGSCDTQSGQCSNPAKVDGTACNDGNACTQTDSCQAGICAPGNAVTCAAQDECHAIGVCDPASGLCSNPAKPDGAPCSGGGVCTAGVCGLLEAGTDGGAGGSGSSASSTSSTSSASSASSGSGGGSGSSGTSGSGGAAGVTTSSSGESSSSTGGGEPSDPAGCGCGVTGSPATGGLWVGLALGLALRRRRERTLAARSTPLERS